MSASTGPAPYVICWQQQAAGDESTFRQYTCTSLADAELALACLARDPASEGIRCSWLEPTLLGELAQLPF